MRELQPLLDAYHRGGSPIAWCEHGLAIPLNFMTKTIQQVPLINGLSEAGAIYIKPGENSKWVDVDTGDGPTRCVCVLPQAAREFGFEPSDDDSAVAADDVDDDDDADFPVLD